MNIDQKKAVLVIQRLRRRAKNLRFSSLVILLTIIGSIVAGSTFFLSAGELSANETAERISKLMMFIALN